MIANRHAIELRYYTHAASSCSVIAASGAENVVLRVVQDRSSCAPAHASLKTTQKDRSYTTTQMNEDAVAAILSCAEAAQTLYHRLVLVVGPGGSGKTATLRAAAARAGAPVLSLNLELSRRLLDLTARQRLLEVPRALDDLMGRDRPLVLLDNTELLFDPALKQDPLSLLQRASRNRTIVAAWNGTLGNGFLSYAEPDHPEYRRYRSDGLMAVTLKP